MRKKIAEEVEEKISFGPETKKDPAKHFVELGWKAQVQIVRMYFKLDLNVQGGNPIDQWFSTCGNRMKLYGATHIVLKC